MLPENVLKSREAFSTDTLKLKTNQKNRDYSIDLLKAIAIIGVIVIHTCGGGYNYPIASFNWISTIFWGSLTRASVPIFFMCSGALMLNPEKDLSLQKLFSHNIVRILLSMLFWAMAYKCYRLHAKDALSFINLIQAGKEVLLGKQEFHFYYLQIILLVYICLPITRTLVCHASKKQLQYTIGVWFALGIIYPTVQSFWPFRLLSGIPTQWQINMTYAAIGYGIVGYYIKRYSLSKNRYYFACWLVGFVIVFGGTCWISIRNGSLCQCFLEGMSIGVAVMAIGIFGLCIVLFSRYPIKRTGGILFLSRASFCIYLVHVYFLYKFYHWGIGIDCFACLVSIPFIALLALLLSCLVYCVLRKIPIINQWLI